MASKLLIRLSIVATVFILKVAANYEIELREVEATIPNDDKYINFDKLKVKRKDRNEKHKVYGDMAFFEGITEDIELVGELYIKQGGEYRKTVYKLKDNLCNIIETETVFAPSVIAPILPKFPEKCPVPAGNYTMNGFFPDPTNVPPVLQSGDYMAHCQFMRDGKFLQGAKVYVHIINQKGGQIGLK